MANGLFTALGEAAVTGNKPERPNIWLTIIMVIALLLFMLGFGITAYAHDIHLAQLDQPFKVVDLITCPDGSSIYETESHGCFKLYKVARLSQYEGLHVKMVPSCLCSDITD